MPLESLYWELQEHETKLQTQKCRGTVTRLCDKTGGIREREQKAETGKERGWEGTGREGGEMTREGDR